MVFPTYLSWKCLADTRQEMIGLYMYSFAGWGTYNCLLRRLRHINHDG